MMKSILTPTFFNNGRSKIYQHYGHQIFAATINNLSLTVLAILDSDIDYKKASLRLYVEASIQTATLVRLAAFLVLR